jgi:2-keto-4-pentenoate hydratase
MTIDLPRAAAALLEARRTGKPAGPLPPGLAPQTEAEGNALQLAYAGLVGAVPPAGFKIGATAKRMQDYLGLTRPAVGFMAAAGLHRSGVSLPFAGFRGVGVECEIGVRLARDLPHGAHDAAGVAAAVGEVFAAIEIVENRYGKPPAGDLKAVGTATLIADQVYHGGAVLGAPAPDWRARDLGAIAGRITVDGTERGAGTGADLLGHPMQALAWLAGSDAAHVFGGLRAGQVMMLGSVTPPIWLDGPCEVRVAFDGLGEAVLRLT